MRFVRLPKGKPTASSLEACLHVNRSDFENDVQLMMEYQNLDKIRPESQRMSTKVNIEMRAIGFAGASSIRISSSKSK